MIVELPCILDITTPEQTLASLVTFTRSDVELCESSYGVLIEAAHALPTLEAVASFLSDHEEPPHTELWDEDDVPLSGNRLLGFRMCAVWCAMRTNHSDWGMKVTFENLAAVAGEACVKTLIPTHAPRFLNAENGENINISADNIANLKVEAKERGIVQ